MLVAAAEPLGDPEVVLRQPGCSTSRQAHSGPAEAAELLGIGRRVQFRHPLVRSAVYRAAPPASRQRVHEVLAEVSHSAADADRRAWHHALAAASPDEDVAAELEESAGRAQARGGVAATAAFLQRAVALTPDPAPRARRALAAAYAHIEAGAFRTARGLLATAEAGPLDELQRARIDLLRAQLAFVSSRGTDAIPLLLAAARRLERLDIAVALETYVDAFSAALFGARRSGPVGLREIADAARAAQAIRRSTAAERRDRGRVARRPGCPRRRLCRGRPALPKGGAAAFRRRGFGQGTAALAVARLRHRASRSGMTNTRPRCRAPALRSLVRQGRSASLRSHSARARPCSCSAATSPPPPPPSPKRRLSSRRPEFAPRPTERSWSRRGEEGRTKPRTSSR